ncbi:O-methyltransferase [Shouchella lonarensis]|uniref:tRNA 5-hydroxyuridine methyltransferase n=1 Tax=Shouchella lonarensis TaxID=1464122 RepID=A0A1G6JKG9_9BACI|nr:O-methyltransferase [Shouchella lonarensis]SDC19161.1 caffeoyl-CoA O-methyltransferase [Shouchella lonarensis]
MINNRVKGYVESWIPDRVPLLQEMERVAKVENVPIMELISLEMMLSHLLLQQPKRILEIGTAIGYSAIRMALAIPSAHIVTIERDPVRFAQAEGFVTEAKLQDRITLIHADATEAVNQVVHFQPFDVLFIDAAKGQYRTFFEQYEPFVKAGGVIWSDNVLFRGLVAVADEEISEKRLRPLVKKIRHYNEWLMKHPTYETRVYPIGDGVACSVKKL